jgi:ribosomal protein S18 acetylase RimI-like enzyme
MNRRGMSDGGPMARAGCAPFIVLTLPRSRSAWLSRFLTYRDWHCGHDELRHMRQIEDARSWLAQPATGTVETAVAPFWRLARHLRPDVRFVTIRRDPEEVAESIVRCGLASDLDATVRAMRRLDHKLGQIERRTGARSFRFEDLAREEVCADLFEHLLPYRHDSARWAELDRQNVQINVPALNRYVAAHRTQIDRLGAIARQKSLALLSSRRVPDVAGLNVGFEPFRELLRDGAPLIREHIAEVGEHPDNLSRKNLPLLQAIDDAGGMQVTVARSNGRVFGYLITTLGESLEQAGRQWACHTAFYASPDYPGLGLKLQRKAAEGLRARGVHEVAMRAGVRGSGDRVSALYRRLGAEPFGEFYRLELGGAA